jgi:hypothetical protein
MRFSRRFGLAVASFASIRSTNKPSFKSSSKRGPRGPTRFLLLARVRATFGGRANWLSTKTLEHAARVGSKSQDG